VVDGIRAHDDAATLSCEPRSVDVLLDLQGGHAEALSQIMIRRSHVEDRVIEQIFNRGAFEGIWMKTLLQEIHEVLRDFPILVEARCALVALLGFAVDHLNQQQTLKGKCKHTHTHPTHTH